MSNIVQISPPRSGSTLVYRILTFLFPNTHIQKAHDLHSVNLNNLNVITIRDIRDCIVSYMLLFHENITDETLEENMTYFVDQRYIFYGEHLRNKTNLILKYEEFYTNYEIIFDGIENFLNVTITNKQRKFIETNFGVKQTQEYQRQFRDFNEHNRTTKIHGKHIFDAKVGKWKEFLNEKQQERISKTFNDYLVFWDYL